MQSSVERSNGPSTATTRNFSLLTSLPFSIRKTPNKKITSKLNLFTGILCYLSLLVGCFIVMFIIEAQQDASQNRNWALNFIIAFGQDLSLSPFMSLFNKVSFFKLSQTRRFIKLLKSPRIVAFFLPSNFRSIYIIFLLSLLPHISLLASYFRKANNHDDHRRLPISKDNNHEPIIY